MSNKKTFVITAAPDIEYIIECSQEIADEIHKMSFKIKTMADLIAFQSYLTTKKIKIIDKYEDVLFEIDYAAEQEEDEDTSDNYVNLEEEIDFDDEISEDDLDDELETLLDRALEDEEK